eukprot:10763-Heterococcus_DN1.PRE.1
MVFPLAALTIEFCTRTTHAAHDLQVLAALRHTKGRRAGPALKAEIDAIACKRIVTKQQQPQQRHTQQQQQPQHPQQQQRGSAVITIPSVQRTTAAASATGRDTDVHSSTVQVVARHRPAFDAAATATTSAIATSAASVTAATTSSSCSDSNSGNAAAVDANANALALSMIRKLQQQLKSERQERAVAEAALQSANMGLLSARIRKDNLLLQRSSSVASITATTTAAAVTIATAASSTGAAASVCSGAKH